MSELDFIPVRGTENAILSQKAVDGCLYVATDTGKIYTGIYDSALDDTILKAIGGSGATLLYSKALDSDHQLPDETYLLTTADLENSEATINVDDLIITKDGKFLRVTALQANGSFICSIIAVSGTGGGTGGGSGGGVSVGTASITSLVNQSFNYRYGDTAKVKFNFVSTYADGTPSGTAVATFHINNGVAVYETEIEQGVNEIDVTKILNPGRQRLTIRIAADIGAANPQTITYTWTITATQLVLNWNYDIATINDSNSTFKLKWYVSGDEVEKTTHIIIDNNVALETKVTTTVNSKNEEINLEGLPHGVHTISMYMDAKIGTSTLSTPSITYQLIFIDQEKGLTPVVAYNLKSKAISQYDTASIDIVAYEPKAVANKTTLIIRENDKDIDTFKDITNGAKLAWNYTPVKAGDQKITFVCGTTEVSFTFNVQAIDLGDTEEVTGYAFKLKASDISSNTALQEWKAELTDAIYNNWTEDEKLVDITFSDNFDWINGGLQQEELRDSLNNIIGKRNYICVRAGTSMTINYNLFKMPSTTVRNRGKCLKFIFKATNCRDYNAQVLSCYNQSIGLVMNAQGASLAIGGEILSTPYCEDSYIEFEFDIWTQETDEYGRRYIMFWLDGVPTGIKVYTANASLEQVSPVPITIGSADCDINIYLIKAYEKHLDDNEHLNNFIMDAYNANEMMARFLRNDILESGRISYTKLVERNPGCQAYLYDIPRMTKNKKDKVGTGEGGANDYITFALYENTSTAPVVTAKDVVMKVQGTSSARYGVAAFNIDSEFTDGFTTAAGEHIDGYSLSNNSIPINYFCTKVNVASSEGANNALNQEWYNNYQPWKNRLRRKNSKARDCMEFKPGIVFLRDRNTTTAAGANGAATEYDTRNVFEDTEGYIQNPYYKLYAVGCMGNSKDNIEVLHDITNPYECCIEVADNQEAGQWMTIPQGAYISKDASGNDVAILVNFEPDASLDDSSLCPDGVTRSNRVLWETGLENLYEFRYPDGIGDLKEMFKTWTDEDKAKWDLQSLVNEQILTEDRLNVNPYTSAVEGWYRFVTWMAKSNPAAYTGAPLAEKVHFEPHTFATQDKDFVKAYNNGSLAGVTINTYAGDYEYDTYEYRMAKMLSECEDYLCMESVVFHYLFIERHTMVDNVAKNTFWSTEDGIHWNLTKNYDNDTADGNDNQGRLSLTYGIECLDIKDEISGTRYFNAYQSVWLNFINGLYTARKVVYTACNSRGAWSSANYLAAFEKWQSCIPERCWIEDYYRKYRRPRELGLDGEKFYLEMLEGGKKTHQREQYETYQDSYITSLYNPENYEGTNVITLRSNGTLPSIDNIVDTIDIILYADGYIRAKVGSTESIPIRAKRGEQHSIQFSSLTDMELNNATFYIPFASNVQSITNIGSASPTQLSFSSAKKLREIDVNHDALNPNRILQSIGFSGAPLLEKIIAQYCPNTKTALDLSSLKNLKEIWVNGSGFTNVTFADGGLLETAHLNNIEGLTMKNLIYLEDFSIEDYQKLRSVDIVNSNIDTYDLLNKIKNTVTNFEGGDILSYNIQGATWLINEANNNINLENGTIPMLEYLNDSKTAKPISGIEKALALTKEMIFDDTIVLTGNYKAIDYYNKYINSNEFSGFDIAFENGDIPLVSIEDIAGNIQWSRRIEAGSVITQEFLTDGSAPDGIFIKPKDYNDAKYDYIFLNKWNVYSEDGELLTSTPIENELPIGYVVNQNVIIKPIIQRPLPLRKFSINFLKADGVTPIAGYPKQIEYGTAASAAMPAITPIWEGAEPENLYYTYKFLGYAVNNNQGQVIDLDKIIITSDIEFISIFGESHVYLNPLDQSYYTVDNLGVLNINNDVTLKGKITIPYKSIDNKIVKSIGIGAFQHGMYNKDMSQVTHIFFEPAEIIKDDNGNMLSYVENTNEIILELNAFSNCGYLATGTTLIEIPPNLKIKEGVNALANANFKKAIFSLSTESIADNLFAGNETLTSVNLNDLKQLKHIGNMAFNGCTRLVYENIVELPNLESIGVEALNGGKFNNTEFYLPNNLKFGGMVSSIPCKLLQFGDDDSDSANFSFITEAPVTAIWAADNIYLYGATENSDAYTFISQYISGTLTAK